MHKSQNFYFYPINEQSILSIFQRERGYGLMEKHNSKPKSDKYK